MTDGVRPLLVGRLVLWPQRLSRSRAFLHQVAAQPSKELQARRWPVEVGLHMKFSTMSGDLHRAADVRARLEEVISSNPTDFGCFSSKSELDAATFEKLVRGIVPDMSHEECKALFMSMGTSNDGFTAQPSKELQAPRWPVAVGPHVKFSATSGDMSCTADVRARLEEVMSSNPADFGCFFQKNELDAATFEKLARGIIPNMSREECKALFTSMDASSDGCIQAAEIFSNTTLSILLNRMSATVSHPLEGSYHCLPRPPFHSDPNQLKALEALKVVFDNVVAAHRKPVPAAPRVSKQASPSAAPTAFASIFGAFSRARAPVAESRRDAKGAVTETFVPTPNAPKGAYLYGGCGCGKTILLDLFFRSLPEGFTVRRLHWHEFIRDAFRAMQKSPPGGNVFSEMADGLAKEFRVLLLDELLITNISEAILVKNLFRHMWARGMTIVTTSNYLPEELYAKGFNRDQFAPFIPELTVQCPVIDMSSSKDYRKTDAHLNNNLFFYPISDETDMHVNKTFKEVCGSNIELDVQIPIPMERRYLTVPTAGYDAHGNRVGRFSFHDLCGKSLGRADYGVVAENFHTIFIDRVPKYTADLGAEFRRFVCLTDILYGKRVALHMQSEVHTNDLFAESLNGASEFDELWAFRRCSSMLSEMQNAKYHHVVWLMRNHMLQDAALHL